MAKAIEVEFKSKKAQAFIKSIAGNTEKVVDAETVYSNIVGIFVFQDVIDHFEKEKGPQEPWEVWSASYDKQMVRQGKAGNQILQDSGRLRGSFQAGSFRKKAKGIEWFNNAKTAGGFPYAFAHDNKEKARKTLPRRPFMWLSNKAMTKISEGTLAFVVKDT